MNRDLSVFSSDSWTNSPYDYYYDNTMLYNLSSEQTLNKTIIIGAMIQLDGVLNVDAFGSALTIAIEDFVQAGGLNVDVNFRFVDKF